MFQTSKCMDLIFSHTFWSPKEKENADIQLATWKVVLHQLGPRLPGC